MPQPYAQISAKKRCVWEVDEEHGCLIVDTLHKLINQIIGGQPQPTKAVTLAFSLITVNESP